MLETTGNREIIGIKRPVMREVRPRHDVIIGYWDNLLNAPHEEWWSTMEKTSQQYTVQNTLKCTAFIVMWDTNVFVLLIVGIGELMISKLVYRLDDAKALHETMLSQFEYREHISGNFNVHTFRFKKMPWNMTSEKVPPFCLGLSDLALFGWRLRYIYIYINFSARGASFCDR